MVGHFFDICYHLPSLCLLCADTLEPEEFLAFTFLSNLIGICLVFGKVRARNAKQQQLTFSPLSLSPLKCHFTDLLLLVLLLSRVYRLCHTALGFEDRETVCVFWWRVPRPATLRTMPHSLTDFRRQWPDDVEALP